MSGTEKARGGGLFKVTVPQAVEKFAVFNHTKKCFLCSGNFQHRLHIFCAAVVNGKCFLAVRKSHRCNQRGRPRQRKNCAAIVKDKAVWFRWANDNFLITVPFSGSFVPLITVLFVGERG